MIVIVVKDNNNKDVELELTMNEFGEIRGILHFDTDDVDEPEDPETDSSRSVEIEFKLTDLVAVVSAFNSFPESS